MVAAAPFLVGEATKHTTLPPGSFRWRLNANPDAAQPSSTNQAVGLGGWDKNKPAAGLSKLVHVHMYTPT